MVHATRKTKVDNMTAEFLRAIGEHGIDFMWKICDNVWMTRNCLEDWTKGILQPLLKKGVITE